jgi:hypothetical protein
MAGGHHDRRGEDMLSVRQAMTIPSGLVDLSHTGERIVEMANTFQLVADGLGLNNGITDRRRRLHTHPLGLRNNP